MSVPYTRDKLVNLNTNEAIPLVLSWDYEHWVHVQRVYLTICLTTHSITNIIV